MKIQDINSGYKTKNTYIERSQIDSLLRYKDAGCMLMIAKIELLFNLGLVMSTCDLVIQTV